MSRQFSLHTCYTNIYRAVTKRLKRGKNVKYISRVKLIKSSFLKEFDLGHRQTAAHPTLVALSRGAPEASSPPCAL